MLFESVENRAKVAWQPGWAALWVITSGIGLFLHPDPAGHGTHQELGLPPCPSALFFDRPCPGCGLTTSWSALLHGQWAFAFHAHPLGPVLYLGFTASALLAAYGFVAKKRLVLDSVGMSRSLAAFSILFLIFGLTRMALTPHFRTDREAGIASDLVQSR